MRLHLHSNSLTLSQSMEVTFMCDRGQRDLIASCGTHLDDFVNKIAQYEPILYPF